MTERLWNLVLCFDMTIVVIVLNIFALQIRLNIALEKRDMLFERHTKPIALPKHSLLPCQRGEELSLARSDNDTAHSPLQEQDRTALQSCPQLSVSWLHQSRFLQFPAQNGQQERSATNMSINLVHLFIFVVKGIILEDFGDTWGVLAVFVDLIHFVAPSHSSLLEWFTGYHDDAFLTSPFLFVRLIHAHQ